MLAILSNSFHLFLLSIYSFPHHLKKDYFRQKSTSTNDTNSVHGFPAYMIVFLYRCCDDRRWCVMRCKYCHEPIVAKRKKQQKRLSKGLIIASFIVVVALFCPWKCNKFNYRLVVTIAANFEYQTRKWNFIWWANARQINWNCVSFCLYNVYELAARVGVFIWWTWACHSERPRRQR